ncbi:MAG TPA: hypothetical protein VK196_11580, partial [Magnetospirillum sp.]|nr:hypothetical protein [Magnetospirillum sp.]
MFAVERNRRAGGQRAGKAQQGIAVGLQPLGGAAAVMVEHHHLGVGGQTGQNRVGVFPQVQHQPAPAHVGAFRQHGVQGGGANAAGHPVGQGVDRAAAPLPGRHHGRSLVVVQRRGDHVDHPVGSGDGKRVGQHGRLGAPWLDGKHVDVGGGMGGGIKTDGAIPGAHVHQQVAGLQMGVQEGAAGRLGPGFGLDAGIARASGLGQQGAQMVARGLHRRGPVARARLAEQPGRAVPGRLLAPQHPDAVGRRGQQHADRNTQRPGQMGDGSIGGHHHVHLGDPRGQIGKVADGRRQIGDQRRVQHLGHLARGQAGLQAVGGESGKGKQRHKPGKGDVVIVSRAGPGDAH